MPCMRSLSTVLLGLALLVGCGAPAVAPPAAPAPPSPAATSAPVTPAGAIALTGAVKTATVLTAQQLAALPQQTVQISFTSGGTPEQHTETGVPLAAVLPLDALAVTDRRNDQLSFVVLAVGADGYSAAVAYGDVAADFGNRGLLISLNEDGAALERPRLIVPGDVRGGRYVSDLVELRVVRLG